MTDSDDKANVPWSVKGVSKEAREAVKKAAAEEGVTMGEWLSKVIRAAESAPADPLPDDDDLVLVEREETTMAGPLADAVSETGLAVGGDAGTAAGTEDLRAGVASRVAEAEDRILAVVEPLQEIIQQLSTRLEALERMAGAPGETRDTTSLPQSYRKVGWD